LWAGESSQNIGAITEGKNDIRRKVGQSRPQRDNATTVTGKLGQQALLLKKQVQPTTPHQSIHLVAITISIAQRHQGHLMGTL
jgi:hypothetical protein